jgi:hypothetical protein
MSEFINLEIHKNCQVILKKDNETKYVSTTQVNVQPFIDNVYSKKPQIMNIPNSYIYVFLVKYLNCQYNSDQEGETPYRVDYDDLDENIINTLISEIESVN